MIYMIAIHKSKGKREKGTYTFTNKGITLTCPSCGKASRLDPKIHTVDDNGRVLPSLQCPYDLCIFHDFVTLLDWKDPVINTLEKPQVDILN